MTADVFDRIFDAGSAAVLGGTHAVDAPPLDGGRWPVSVVCLPDDGAALRLEQEMRAAEELAGPGHFVTGRRDAVHCTVRSLEEHRAAAAYDEPVSAQWARAVRTSAAETKPFVLDCTGLTLASGSVMASLVPRDDEPWLLMERLGSHLGELSWYEDQWPPRDIWYATILHFAGPVTDPAALVAHVAERRAWTPFPVVVDALALCRYRHRRDGNDQLMLPEVWLREPLAMP